MSHRHLTDENLNVVFSTLYTFIFSLHSLDNFNNISVLLISFPTYGILKGLVMHSNTLKYGIPLGMK